MKRKKQGASLIVVVILFMFISTVSMAMLSMVASNYKARVVESKRVENLYSSDSGLDVTYNIIGKTFDAATKYGYYEVQELKSTGGNTKSPNDEKYKDIEADIDLLNNDINNFKNEKPTDIRPQSAIDQDIAQAKSLILEDQNIEQILLNEEFKRAFKNFIAKTTTSQLGEVPPDKLKDSIEKHRYVVVSVEDINTINFDEQTIEFANENGQSPEIKLEEIDNPENVSGSLDQTKGIYSKSDGGKHYKTVEFTVYGKQQYDNIIVSSDFYTKKINENAINERKLQAKYTMKVPNYEDIYFQNSTGELHQYLATKDRALTIFGDMNVNNATDLKVDGEIFVQGSPDHSTDNRIYGKYFGGITVNNSTGVSFTKDVSTRGTFNIQDASGITIGENLYAKNIYAGNIENNSDDNNSGSILNVNNLDKDKGQVIIDNDLALNLKNTTVNIKDFYGINDKEDIDKSTVAAKKSSSIIVNGNYNSTNLYITGSAYIMGMAHIATVGDYQTAESGAVKGNYIAYSVPLTDDEKKTYNDSLTDDEKKTYSIPLDKTEIFAYHDPLQLLEPDTDDPNITAQQAKENHFLAYWDQEGRNPDVGGIHWPVNDDGSINVYSIGAIVYKKEDETKGVVIPSKYSQDLFLDDKPVGKSRIDFAQKVYKFGETANISDYNNTIVTDFTSLINTGNIPSEYVLLDQNNKGEYAIFNGDESKEVKIVTSTDAEDTISSTGNTITIKVANKDSGHTISAVIASAGKVSIEAGITINGCIIAEGDLDINGNGVTINYDSGVIERVQAQNIDTFKAVFGESIVDDTDDTTSDAGANTDSATNYDLKNFLEDKSWKILK